jgi:hypothetical protein
MLRWQYCGIVTSNFAFFGLRADLGLLLPTLIKRWPSGKILVAHLFWWRSQQPQQPELLLPCAFKKRFGVTAREYARDLRHAAQKLDCLADGEVLFVFLILPGAMTALGFRNE